MEPYLGEIRIFGGNYAPAGWAFCSGQLLPVSGNEALYALLGTTYGGNGQTTFALPDLRGRLPLHLGQASSGQNYPLGARGGAEQVNLSEAQLPAHTHQAKGSANGSVGSPQAACWAATSAVPAYSTVTPTTHMGPQAVMPTGGSQPHDNLMPSLGLSFIIALQGIYPTPN
ncbi:phage tail protein [Pseudaeromonas paramecii]|uniref:Tail fiber protein n=1 Tax=Pseudaeromonas paramecii TaxID=2138166 RepID=A0ABP8QLA1_9GAMM